MTNKEQWQPIETAPKDGTRILLYYPARTLFSSATTVFGRWEAEVHAKKPRPYWSSDISFIGITAHRESPPTHWMHKPAAPETAIGQ